MKEKKFEIKISFEFILLFEMEIPNFPNYIIYPDGRVYNKKFGKKRPIKAHKMVDGYIGLSLCKDGKKYLLKQHRVLAELFIENPHNLDVVDHVDRNKSNNCLSNLRWVTLSQNSRNSTIPKNNKSGHMGVRIEQKKTHIAYRAFWTLPKQDDKRNRTGSKSFRTLEEAINCRKEMEKKYYK